VNETLVLADHRSAGIDDFAGPRHVRPTLRYEISVTSLADEANLLAFFLVRNWQPKGPGQRAHLRLDEGAERKADVAKLILVDGVEDVALVLAAVERAEQAMGLAVRAASPVPPAAPNASRFSRSSA